jgi:hypothetical protein
MNYRGPLLAFLFCATLVGCATAVKPQAETVVGSYNMVAGGFNESLRLELKKDFSYSMDHELISCTGLASTYSREEGLWNLADGLVLLEPKARTERFPDASVFAPAAFRKLLPKADKTGSYLVRPESPTKFVLQKEDLANHAPDPTALSVTPAADAPVVPAIGRGSS